MTQASVRRVGYTHNAATMTSKTPDRFTLFVPDEREPERELPARLELVDDSPAALARRKALVGGAYDPYEKTGPTGDTARMHKPRVDLRKLSEWIKTTQKVKALREEDLPGMDGTGPRRR